MRKSEPARTEEKSWGKDALQRHVIMVRFFSSLHFSDASATLILRARYKMCVSRSSVGAIPWCCSKCLDGWKKEARTPSGNSVLFRRLHVFFLLFFVFLQKTLYECKKLRSIDHLAGGYNEALRQPMCKLHTMLLHCSRCGFSHIANLTFNQ